jgi:hypothetical protein
MSDPIRPNPSRRGGTSQADRRLPGLSPRHVRIDERTIADRIVFAAEMARHLRFPTTTGGDVAGGWTRFFASDLSALLAGMASQDVEGWRTGVRERLAWLRDDDHAADLAGLRRKSGELFGAVAAMASGIDDFQLRLPPEHPLRASLGQRIQTRLSPALRRLVAHHRAARASGVLDAPLVGDPSAPWLVVGREVVDAQSLLTGSPSLSGSWWVAPGGYLGVPADEGVFQVPGGGAPSAATAAACLVHASNHFLFTSIFDAFTESLARLVDDATQALLESLENKDDHAPHYALFLAFLRLRGAVQDRLNGLLWRHLDHYYQDILRLRPKPPEPDHLHLVAELSRSTASASLPAGTLFKAGKDSSGRELTYALDRETTFNTAKVAHLLSLHEDLPPFAGPSSAVTAPAPLPRRREGFAVASHYLFLAEGARTILLRFDGLSLAGLPASRLRCYLTHAKGWLEKTPTDVRAGTFTGGGECTEIEIRLDGSDPAISAWNAKVHQGGFAVAMPVVQCLLLPDQALPGGDYDRIKGVVVRSLEVVVRVGAVSSSAYDPTGAKALLASNEGGRLDVSKPFLPWGVLPRKDSPFVVGHAEAFSKRHATLNMHIAWAGREATITPSPTATLQFLDGGQWKPAADLPGAFTACANPVQRTFPVDVGLPESAVHDWREPYAALGPSTRAGFLRVVLDADFGQSGYQSALTAHLVALARTGSSTPPPAVYLPQVASIHLGYTATTRVVDLDDGGPAERPARLFQVGPFGEAEQAHPLPAGRSRFLVPQFRFTEGADTHDHLGAWIVGLSDLAPGQGVDLLVTVREGSADPRVAKPEDHVAWSYWSVDRWVPFVERDVADGTRQLLQTGIVRLAIPRDATLDQGAMPRGFVWIMASVTRSLGAVGAVLGVATQALRATLSNLDVAPDHLDVPLAAGTVSKLLESDARFRKFAQPHASFGGRRTESGERFHRRTSERLRHKGRAVTMWDYENLVLEAFPSLYRVKCLPHTRIADDPATGASDLCGNARGHVTVVVVPSVQDVADPATLLQPHANQELLAAVRDHLGRRTTGQIVSGSGASRRSNLHVCNPVFEEVLLDFGLRLRPGYDHDFAWYEALLRTEIARHLAPWAFAGPSDDPARAPDVQFGGRVAKSSLVRFVEERPYVDHIVDVVLRQRVDGVVGGDLEEAVASTARSVLTAAPPSQHVVRPIP